MLAQTSYITALAVNVIWFGMGFHYFSFKQHAAAKVMIPKGERGSPIFPTMAAAIRFLGGMNGAWTLMSLLLLVLVLTDSGLFTASGERALVLAVFASAHASQFIFNLPVLKNGERQGSSFWPVLSGPMLFIFVTDFVTMVINAGAAVLQL